MRKIKIDPAQSMFISLKRQLVYAYLLGSFQIVLTAHFSRVFPFKLAENDLIDIRTRCRIWTKIEAKCSMGGRVVDPLAMVWVRAPARELDYMLVSRVCYKSCFSLLCHEGFSPVSLAFLSSTNKLTVCKDVYRIMKKRVWEEVSNW